jgi:Fic family protein
MEYYSCYLSTLPIESNKMTALNWIQTLPKAIQILSEEWLGLQPVKSEYLSRIWQKFRIEWSYHSNRIEGSSLSYENTILLLIHGRTKGDHFFREYEEMKGHDKAIEYIRELSQENRHLTESDIRDVNKILLKEGFYKVAETLEGEQIRKWIEPGKYKSQANHVLTAQGDIFQFTPPESVSSEMQSFIEWMKIESESQTIPFLAFLAKLHHKFTLIHPFDDGNGRVIRILLNYYLLKLNLPPMVISSSKRKEYLSALASADSGDLTGLEVFLESSMEKSLQLAIRGCKEFLPLEGDEIG